jgi:hypothetical protein
MLLGRLMSFCSVSTSISDDPEYLPGLTFNQTK